MWFTAKVVCTEKCSTLEKKAENQWPKDISLEVRKRRANYTQREKNKKMIKIQRIMKQKTNYSVEEN